MPILNKQQQQLSSPAQFAATGISADSLTHAENLRAANLEAPQPSAFAAAMRSFNSLGVIASQPALTGRRDGFAAADVVNEQFLRERPWALNAIDHLIAAESEDDFWAIERNAQREFDDLTTLAQAGLTSSVSAGLLAAAADPINLIPLGSAATVARGASLTSQIPRIAAVGSTAALASDEAIRQLQTADDPTTANAERLMAAGMGAAFGTLIGSVASPQVLGRATDAYAKVAARGQPQNQAVPDVAKMFGAMQTDVARLRSEIRDAFLETGRGQEGITAVGALGDSEVKLRELLVTDPAELPDGATVSFLHRPAGAVEGVPQDINAEMMEQLRDKYRKAGKTVNIVEHPYQHEYLQWSATEHVLGDTFRSVNTLDPGFWALQADEPVNPAANYQAPGVTQEAWGMLARFAGGEDFARWAPWMRDILPAKASLDANPLDEVHALKRALFIDPTASKAAFTQPEFAGVVSAELRARDFEAMYLNAQRQVDDAFNPLRKTMTHGLRERLSAQPIEYTNIRGEAKAINRLTGERDFYDAITDVRSTRAMAKQGIITENVDEWMATLPPEVAEGVKAVDAYTAQMLDEGDKVGVLPGRRELAELESRIEYLDSRISELDEVAPEPLAPDAPEDPGVKTRFAPALPEQFVSVDAVYRHPSKGWILKGDGGEFDSRFLRDHELIHVGDDPMLVREIRKITDEVIAAHQKEGKYWTKTAYFVPKEAIEVARARMARRANAAFDDKVRPLYEAKDALEQERLRIQEFHRTAEDYFTRRYDVDAIKNDHNGFLDWLVSSWQKQRRLEFDPTTGERFMVADDMDRPLQRTPLERLKAELRAEGVDDVIGGHVTTERELASSVNDYLNDISRARDEAFDEAFQTVTLSLGDEDLALDLFIERVHDAAYSAGGKWRGTVEEDKIIQSMIDLGYVRSAEEYRDLMRQVSFIETEDGKPMLTTYAGDLFIDFGKPKRAALAPDPQKAAQEAAERIAQSPTASRIMERYEELVSAYFDNEARNVLEKITQSPEAAHGIQHTLNFTNDIGNMDMSGGVKLRSQTFATPNEFKARTMFVDETAPAASQFLRRDLDNTLRQYSQSAGGRMAMVKAIRDAKAAGMLPPGYEHAETPEMLLGTFKYRMDKTAGAIAQFDKERGTSFAPRFAKNADNAHKTMLAKMELMQGQRVTGTTIDPDSLWTYGWRKAMNGTYQALLGSSLLSMMSDSVGMIAFTDNPRGFGHIAKTIRGMKALDERDMKAFISGLEAERSRQFKLGDIEFEDRRGVARTPLGSRIDKVTNASAHVFNTATGANWWNRSARSVAAQFAALNLHDGLGAMTGIGTRTSPDATMAQMRQLGINPSRAKRIVSLIRKHGRDVDGKPLAELSDAEFAALDGQYSPGLNDWKLDGDEAEELRKTYSAFIDQQVLDGMVVEPDLLSRPLWADKSLAGQIFFQFHTFGMKFSNSVVQPLANRSSKRILATASAAIAIQAILQGLKTHISGYRDIDETAKNWAERPLAMMSESVYASGVLGTLTRPIAAAESVGLGPVAAMGQDTKISSAAFRADSIFGMFGATVDQAIKAGSVGGQIAQRLSDPDYEIPVKYYHSARTLIPFQNLVWFRLANSITGFDPMRTQNWMDEEYGDK